MEIDLAAALATGLTVFDPTLFNSLRSLLTALGGKILLADAFAVLTLPADTVEAMTTFFGSGFSFAVTVFAAILLVVFEFVFATAATLFFGAAILVETTFVVPFAAIFDAGLATAFTTGLVVGAGFAVLVAGLVAVFPADLDELLVVAIFRADPNFRLAAFFSLALDFFALEATGGFAGFFML